MVGLFFKIDHGLFRVLGPKYDKKSPYGFGFLIFSLLPFIVTPKFKTYFEKNHTVHLGNVFDLFFFTRKNCFRA